MKARTSFYLFKFPGDFEATTCLAFIQEEIGRLVPLPIFEHFITDLTRPAGTRNTTTTADRSRQTDAISLPISSCIVCSEERRVAVGGTENTISVPTGFSVG